MKKSILLLSASLLVAGFSNGQVVSKKSAILNNANNATSQAVVTANGVSRTVTQTTHSNQSAGVGQTKNAGHKTTVGGGRWYDYIDGILAPNVTALDFTGLDIWWDTSSYWGYTGTTAPYEGNRMTSTGLGFHPQFASWNDATNFPGVIAVSSFDAYTIDSTQVLGWYNRNYSKPGVVDTLILTFVYGTGDTTTDLHGYRFTNPTLLGWYGIPSTASLDFLDMLFDSSRHRAGKISGTTVVPVTSATALYKFLLYPSDTNNSNSAMGTQFPRTNRVAMGHPADPAISFAVPAGNTASMSVTFHSGDAAYPVFPGRDTVRLSDGTAVTGFKYGGFRQTIGFAATSSSGGSPNFPPYVAADNTSGYYKREGDAGWNALYIPNWAWSTSSGASALQYPYITYHIQCATCPLTSDPILAVADVTDLNNVTVAPNPANNTMNVSFALATGSTATITLTNMIGQVVAQQTTTTGKSTFNTASLPAGLYVYAVEANGARTTGRVVVAH